MNRTDTDKLFDADGLIDEAVTQAGFDDFGDMPYREGLEPLLETYDRHDGSTTKAHL